MTDLETQVRASLHRLAGPATPRPMPPGVGRGVGRRRVALVAGAALAVAVLTVPVLAVSVGYPRPSPAPPAVSNPYASMPSNWPTVAVTDDPSSDVLVSGTVDGITFRLTAEHDADGGPCLILVVPASGSTKGIRTCLADANAPVPTRADMVLRVIRDEGLGGLEANLGFVSDRVRSLTISTVHGEQEVPVLPAPAGWDVRPFLFFPPPRLDAWLQALDEHGVVLTDTLLCGTGGQMGCRGDVEQVATIPGSFTPAPYPQYGSPPGDEWEYLRPLVEPGSSGDSEVTPTYGGDFTPYVDIEIPSPVVDKKIVVTYGTVGGDPFSVAIYRTDGSQQTNDVGQIDLFWGRAHGADDPGVYGGGSEIGAGTATGNEVSLVLDPRHASDGTRFQVLFGWTAPGVDHLDVRMEDGWLQHVQVQHAGPVDAFGWVLAFIPTGTGAATPVHEDGTEGARWPLCASNGATEAPTCPSWYQG